MCADDEGSKLQRLSMMDGQSFFKSNRSAHKVHDLHVIRPWITGFITNYDKLDGTAFLSNTHGNDMDIYVSYRTHILTSLSHPELDLQCPKC
jgi:hypothetical protein